MALPREMLVALVFVVVCAIVQPTSSFITGPAVQGTGSTGRGLAGARSGLCVQQRTRLPTRGFALLAPRMAVDGDTGQSAAKAETLLDVLPGEPEEGSPVSESDAGGASDVDDEGSFRKRRAEKRRKAAGGQVSSELRFKLLEEQASPFRRFRQFFYAAAAGSASIGLPAHA